jgi:hypothetical protein
MKNGLVILDSGPIFSLASVNRLEILDSLFDKAVIPKAVWQEITFHKTTESYEIIERFLEKRVVEIEGFNELSFVMDYGE